MYVLLADKVSCPMTKHYDSGDSQIILKDFKNAPPA